MQKNYTLPGPPCCPSIPLPNTELGPAPPKSEFDPTQPINEEFPPVLRTDVGPVLPSIEIDPGPSPPRVEDGPPKMLPGPRTEPGPPPSNEDDPGPPCTDEGVWPPNAVITDVGCVGLPNGSIVFRFSAKFRMNSKNLENFRLFTQ